MKRRNVLAALGGTLGIAGCTSRASPDVGGGHVQPDGEPPAKPASLSCSQSEATQFCEQALTRVREEVEDDRTDVDCEEASVERRSQQFPDDAVHWGHDADRNWRMRVEKTAYGPGEVVTIRLRNVSVTTQEHGSQAMYNLQILTQEGWEEILVSGTWPGSAGHGHTLGLHRVYPGQSITWELSLSNEDRHASFLCPEVPAGRYRFAYWGAHEGDEAIAVSFDIEE